MKKRVLSILEYDKIKAAAADFALSAPGRERILSAVPETDYDAVDAALAETDEASSLMAVKVAATVTSFDEITNEIKRLMACAPLSCGELLRVAGVMRAARRAVAGTDMQTAPRLTVLADGLWYDNGIIDDIASCIISDTEIADNASGALRDIRRKIYSEHALIQEKLNGVLRSGAKYLQDNLITVRGGRYVVPVKAECRGDVPGLVHDQSGSGQTLFIEPMSVVESNNRLKLLEAEQAAEVERILAALSSRLYPFARALADDLEILTHFDAVFARAAYAKSIKATLPKLNRDGVTDIKNGRHPLIDPAKVVSISVKLGYDYRALVITGPNTGGKTVTLKLIGLMQLMAQSGYFLPCDAGTRMCVYRDVFADIGDEQSIEQSLSTFSSHMKNTIEIVKRAGSDTLVLLDELGAGTDPAEGAALATAILEELMAKNAPLVATTHYSEIKAFAMSQKYFENAGMEFDVDTLSPTYRLFLGVPGMSNAFLISERLGMPKSVTDRARSHVSEERARFEQVLSEAERERSAATKLNAELSAMREQMEKKDALAKEALERARQQSEQIIDKARENAASIVREAKDETEELISELKAVKQSGRIDDRTVTEAAKRSRERVTNLAEKHARRARREPQHRHISPSEIVIGGDVYIPSLSVTATVLTLPDRSGDLDVQAGMMKLHTNISELSPAAAKKERGAKQASVQFTRKPAQLSIDVHGMDLESALMEVNQYLDDCVCQGLSEVMIVHGKGKGILMTGIREHLRHHPNVDKFRAGKYGEGEMGVTVVTLK